MFSGLGYPRRHVRSQAGSVLLTNVWEPIVTKDLLDAQ